MAFLTAFLIVAACTILWCLWNYLTSPLRSFPGPGIARFTHFWRLRNVFGRSPHLTHIELHRKYGTAVRVGPNIISLEDPRAIPEVFRTRDPWQKTGFYSVNDVVVQGQRLSNMFSTLDENFHTSISRPIKGLYSMTRALDIEPHIDTTIKELLKALEFRFVKPGATCDISEWVTFFAWDSMSRLTVGKPYGMIESGKDNGLIHTSTKGLDYFAPVSQLPILDMLLDKNPIKRIGPPSFMWATIQAFGAIAERQRSPIQEKVNRHSDFLDKFLHAKNEYPNLVDNLVANYLLVNIIAGSDTTSSYMSGALYYILKTPGCLQKLQKELDTVVIDPSGPTSWTDTQRLPYFDAVMKEVQRFHPGTGLMLERVVPDHGFTLPDGRYLPGGTIVGMNSWVVNRHEATFGKDAHSFVPERWLPQQDEDENMFIARSKKMQKALLTFGAGKRKCIGMNIAILTAYKLVSTLINKYDVSSYLLLRMAYNGLRWIM